MKIKYIKNRFSLENSIYKDIFRDQITLGKIYDVIEISFNHYRIITDTDSLPLLFGKEYFEVIDPYIPHFWIKTDWIDEYETLYNYSPPELSNTYMMEKYFDYIPDAIEVFWKKCKDWYNINIHLEDEGVKKDEYRKCISLRSYLKPTEETFTVERNYVFDEFKIIQQVRRFYEIFDINESDSELKVGETYFVEEKKTNYWLKLKGKKYLYPESMFEGFNERFNL